MAGVQWARQILDDDGRRSEIDHLGEPWALALPPIPMEDGEIRGAIVDAQGTPQRQRARPRGAIVAGAHAPRGALRAARRAARGAADDRPTGSTRTARSAKRAPKTRSTSRSAAPHLAAERAAASRRGDRRRQGHDAAGRCRRACRFSRRCRRARRSTSTRRRRKCSRAIVDNLDAERLEAFARRPRAKALHDRRRIPRAPAGRRDARERRRARGRAAAISSHDRGAPGHDAIARARARAPRRRRSVRRSSGRSSSDRPDARRRVNYGDARAPRTSVMTVLRVLLAAAPAADRAEAWALFDAAGACVRKGRDRHGRLARRRSDRGRARRVAGAHRDVALPPMPASRVAGAAALRARRPARGPRRRASRRRVGAGSRRPRARRDRRAIARCRPSSTAAPDVARIVAECDLAAPATDWRWCAREPDAAGFVRRPDGSAFPADAPSPDGALPPELALALAQARRGESPAPRVRVDAPVPSRRRSRAGIAKPASNSFAARRGSGRPRAPRRSPAPSTSCRAPRADDAAPGSKPGRLFAPALAARRRGARAPRGRELRRMGSAARWKRGAMRRNGRRSPPRPASRRRPPPPPPRRALALARRYAELRHAAWHARTRRRAAASRARRARARRRLPAGSVKRASYADGHWTLDLALADPAAIGELDAADARRRRAGAVAPSPNGTAHAVRRIMSARSRCDAARLPRARFARWMASNSPAERRIAVALCDRRRGCAALGRCSGSR